MSLTLQNDVNAMLIPGRTGETTIVTDGGLDMGLTEFVVFATWALDGGMYGHSSNPPFRALPASDTKALLDKLAASVERLRGPYAIIVATQS